MGYSLKQLVKISKANEDLIEHLKGRITPIDQNINKDLMLDKEEKIKLADKGNDYKKIRLGSDISGGLFLGLAGVSLMYDDQELIGSSLLYLALHLYFEHKYNKKVMSDKIIAQQDYLDLLQAMDEYENGKNQNNSEESALNFTNLEDYLNYRRSKNKKDALVGYVKDGKLIFVEYDLETGEEREVDLNEKLGNTPDNDKEK